MSSTTAVEELEAAHPELVTLLRQYESCIQGLEGSESPVDLLRWRTSYEMTRGEILALVARAREEGAREALAPVITAWKSLDREMNSCDYCSDPAVSNAADAVEAALGITEVRP